MVLESAVIRTSYGATSPDQSRTAVYRSDKWVRFNPLSDYHESLAHTVARTAAAYDYNGFSRKRLANSIFFFLFALNPDEREKIKARARALYGSARVSITPGYAYVAPGADGWLYTNDIMAAADRNVAFKWVLDEVSHEIAEQDHRAFLDAYVSDMQD